MRRAMKNGIKNLIYLVSIILMFAGVIDFYMIENKIIWIKHRRNFKLKKLNYIKNSTVDMIRSTKVSTHKQISFSLEDPIPYKVSSISGEDKLKNIK
ncbi:MAG: hypothetical protein ACOCRO_03745 [Halanaerobiales bacterium]